eukprot:GSChrysophyteH1.ASY1.ANO1.56.1 assembled CDS
MSRSSLRSFKDIDVSGYAGEWCKAQRELLALEHMEEKAGLADKLAELSAQECEREGLSLLGLELESTKTGLYGRTVLTLSMKKEKISKNSFKVGDEVKVTAPSLSNIADKYEAATVSGVLLRSSGDNVLEMAARGAADDEVNDALLKASGPLRLDLLANDATHTKMIKALSSVEAAARDTGSPAAPLLRMLFSRPPGDPFYEDAPWAPIPIREYSVNLNISQKAAVEHSLGAPHLACIHGPPGTGKTTTLVELILQCVSRRERVLVCAPSNVAVDNILEKLTPAAIEKMEIGANDLHAPSLRPPSSRAAAALPRPRLCRLGHPARMSEEVWPYCLEALLARSDDAPIVAAVKAELEGGGAKDKAKSLRAEVRRREEELAAQVLLRQDVVLATCVGSGSFALRKLEKNPAYKPFDVVIIDEAAQALEASCWIPLLQGRKAVLAGDHHQLAPTIKSAAAERQGLNMTLFERILRDNQEAPIMALARCSRLLNTQYRMNALISDWSSKTTYDNRLFSGSDAVDDPAAEDSTRSSGMSSSNEHEVQLVLHHVRALTRGLSPEQIGVITPYNGQLELLRTVLKPEFPTLEIRTVDSFQGGEKEAIVMSLVRSNHRGQVGFLSDRRRINVAVTRARRHLCVICDSDTCSRDAFLKSLLDHMSKHGCHRSAAEWLSDPAGNALERGAPKTALFKGDGSLVDRGCRKVRELSDKDIQAMEADGQDQELIFPAELSAKMRSYIHEQCEERGLQHISRGEKLTRRLCVSFKEKETSVAYSTGTATQKTTESSPEADRILMTATDSNPKPDTASDDERNDITEKEVLPAEEPKQPVQPTGKPSNAQRNAHSQFAIKKNKSTAPLPALVPSQAVEKPMPPPPPSNALGVSRGNQVGGTKKPSDAERRAAAAAEKQKERNKMLFAKTTSTYDNNNNDDNDDDAFLEEAMKVAELERAELANHAYDHRYRVPLQSGAMQNKEKNDTRERLRARLNARGHDTLSHTDWKQKEATKARETVHREAPRKLSKTATKQNIAAAAREKIGAAKPAAERDAKVADVMQAARERTEMKRKMREAAEKRAAAAATNSGK